MGAASLRRSHAAGCVRATSQVAVNALAFRALHWTLRMITYLLPLAIALSAPLAVHAAAPTPLTPEQTVDLYARVLLEDDAAAAHTLNDALRPAFNGQDPVEFSKGAFAAGLAAPLQSMLALAGSDAASIEAVPSVVAQNLGGTHCRATHSTVRDNAYVDGAKVANVAFTCSVTALDSLRPLFDASAEENTPASLKRFLETYLVALRTGPRRELTGSIDLYPAKDNGYWYSGNPDALLRPVMAALLPFEAWQQETTAQGAPAITGVAACDALLQQHRRCVVRTAPEQVPGVDAMAAALSAKAAVATPEAMAQECRALRPVAEAMWDTSCR